MLLLRRELLPPLLVSLSPWVFVNVCVVYLEGVNYEHPMFALALPFNDTYYITFISSDTTTNIFFQPSP